MLAHHAAFSADQPSGYPFLAATIPNRGREVAYAVQAHLNDTILGTPERAQYDLYLNYLHRAIAWHTTFKWQGTTEQVSPFILGIIAKALIDDWHRSHDVRVIPTLRVLADWLWYHTWEPSNQAFR
jgi:hypothetical protein